MMKTLSTLRAGGRFLGPVPVLALILAACGNDPGASTAPQPTGTPSAAPSPPPPPPEPAPTATAKASAAAEAPKPSQGSGRPLVLKSDATEITDTFGSSPGSKLELGEGKDIATLRLTEGALRTGTVVTFKLDKGAKSTGGLTGKVYLIRAIVPPGQTPEQVESNGPPFVLELPAGNRKDANLAIGVEDDKGRVKWTIVAAKRIDDSRNVAIFELGTLPSGWLHVTTKAAGK
jgi:hypothetical protein